MRVLGPIRMSAVAIVLIVKAATSKELLLVILLDAPNVMVQEESMKALELIRI